MMEFKILFFLKNVSKKLYLVPMKTVALAIQYVIQSLTSPARYKPAVKGYIYLPLAIISSKPVC